MHKLVAVLLRLRAKARRVLTGREHTVLCGTLRVVHRRQGRVLVDRTYRNLLTNAGIAGVAGLINGVVTAPFTFMALGTGTTAPAFGDTALQAEITTAGGARGAATCTRVTTEIPNDTARLVRKWTFTTGANFALAEAGIFNAASAGVMLARRVFNVVNVQAADEFEIEWTVQQKREP